MVLHGAAIAALFVDQVAHVRMVVPCSGTAYSEVGWTEEIFVDSIFSKVVGAQSPCTQLLRNLMVRSADLESSMSRFFTNRTRDFTKLPTHKNVQTQKDLDACGFANIFIY